MVMEWVIFAVAAYFVVGAFAAAGFGHPALFLSWPVCAASALVGTVLLLVLAIVSVVFVFSLGCGEEQCQ